MLPVFIITKNFDIMLKREVNAESKEHLECS